MVSSDDFAKDYESRIIEEVCDTPHLRSRKVKALGFLIMCMFGLVLVQLYRLQIADFNSWKERAAEQHLTVEERVFPRGQILDRNGSILATSVPVRSIYIRPNAITDKAFVIATLHDELGISRDEITDKLQYQKKFIWIIRGLPQPTVRSLETKKIPGIGIVTESKRFYPLGEDASALIGKVNIDGAGLSGLEKRYDALLHPSQQEREVRRDAHGNPIASDLDDNDFEHTKQPPLELTIDSQLQKIVDEELLQGLREFGGKSAVGILVNARTGEILAYGQAPTFNLNAPEGISSDMLKNYAAETVYEPGSIMKPLVAAVALEKKIVSESQKINCENGSYYFAGKRIKDTHPSAVIPFFDVVVRSSNIGMAKIGAMLGAESLHEALTRFGFGSTSGLGIPGESRGILRPYKSWAKIDLATHAYGQGVAVTPLQVVRAVSAIAYQGVLPKLSLKKNEVGEGTQIISPSIASRVREMMVGVVEDEHGTGRSAAITGGVRVGGKTGTAQKAKPGGKGYLEGKYVTSFVGFGDAQALGVDDVLSLAVMVDEPTGKRPDGSAVTVYGGTIAAPIFKRIMTRVFHHLATISGGQSDGAKAEN
jgi:cell division protein FtsI (penicillin-binding protein 3)